MLRTIGVPVLRDKYPRQGFPTAARWGPWGIGRAGVAVTTASRVGDTDRTEFFSNHQLYEMGAIIGLGRRCRKEA